MGLELGETGSGRGGGFAVKVACCCIGHGSYMRVLCFAPFTQWIFGGGPVDECVSKLGR